MTYRGRRGEYCIRVAASGSFVVLDIDDGCEWVTIDGGSGLCHITDLCPPTVKPPTVKRKRKVMEDLRLTKELVEAFRAAEAVLRLAIRRKLSSDLVPPGYPRRDPIDANAALKRIRAALKLAGTGKQ